MKNKIHLKRYLIFSLIVSVIICVFFTLLNLYEYHSYTKNFNQKIISIISTIEREYPNISENEIIKILNSDSKSYKLLEKYSIDFDKESIIIQNDKLNKQFIIKNIVFLMISITVLIMIFLKYNSKRDKELKEITKYIEEINKKNYHLNINSMSEDEMSILKTEIYKTTVMLKEAAENSKKEKFELKDSLSDISHQLKTPLTSILIILDNLIDDPLMDQDTREDFLRDIKREITNISFLVQSLLKLSRLDTDTVTFIKEDLSLKELVETAIKNVSIICDLKNIEIEKNIIHDEIINCDIKWQIEAVTNILKNSVEHSYNDSKIIVTVNSNKVYSSISIRDFGTGITSEDLPHIFERFYKGKNSSNDSIGIGLALSKSIIEKNNGTIIVNSDKEGTEFIIKNFK